MTRLTASEYRAQMAAPKESNLQIEIMAYLDRVLPGTYWCCHIPNGGRRDAITGAKLKREGVKPGAPDILIVRQGGSMAFLEVKTKAGRLSPAQKTLQDWCVRNAVEYAVVRSVEDVERTLENWRVPGKGRAV